MRIAVASDHAGYRLKRRIREHLETAGHQVRDFGTDGPDAVDYPDYIRPAAEAVARGDCEAGIVMGGSGNGEAIVANKVPGIRCAVCWNLDSGRLAKEHNNANVISMGERLVATQLALQIVDVWLGAVFEGGRHQRRIEKIEARTSAAGGI